MVPTVFLSFYSFNITPVTLSSWFHTSKSFPGEMTTHLRQNVSWKLTFYTAYVGKSKGFFYAILELFYTYIKNLCNTLGTVHLSGEFWATQAQRKVVKTFSFWFFLLGLKYTLRTCFESKNFSSISCSELINQVLSFSVCQMC